MLERSAKRLFKKTRKRYVDKKMKKRRLKFCVIQKQSLLLRSLLQLDFSSKVKK